MTSAIFESGVDLTTWANSFGPIEASDSGLNSVIGGPFGMSVRPTRR